MHVRRIAWVGLPTDRYDDMVRLLRDVMGLRVEFAEDQTAELSLPNDGRVQVFGPGHAYHDFFRGQASGPVVLFEVDDVHAARSELETAGVELIGAIEHDREWEWLHFRAPDGNLYELASRRRSGV